MHRLWIFEVNQTESWILKTQWIVNQQWILVWILDCACLDVRTLGPKQNFSSASMLMRVHPNCFFMEWNSFKLRCETVIGIALCYNSHKACCVLHCLCKINNDIHIYHFTLLWTFTLLFLDVVVVSDLNKKLVSGWICEKLQIRGFAYPYLPLSYNLPCFLTPCPG